MPTGYTDCISKGVDFQTFALGCARAFGALITMRDDPQDAPIPDRFEPTDYHAKALAEARKRQTELEGMSPSLCEMAANGAYRSALETRQKYMAEKAELRRKYEAMLAFAQAWTPPTAEHQGLKDFMVEQLTTSIDFDCKVYGGPPVLQTGEEWRAAEFGKAKWDVEYHSKHHLEEIERANGRTEWVRKLRESLK